MSRKIQVKKENRNYFVFYREFLDVFESLEKDDAIQYIKNVANFALNNQLLDDSNSNIVKSVSKLSITNFNLFNIRLDSSNWAELRGIVFYRDNYTCSYCGQKGNKLECDHIIHISKGGSNKLSNLTTSCINCNRSKNNKTLKEWKKND